MSSFIYYGGLLAGDVILYIPPMVSLMIIIVVY
jgi:hypothetical protein